MSSSSIQGVVPPSVAKQLVRASLPPPVALPVAKGVPLPKRSGVVQRLPVELREKYASAASVPLLQPLPQPFYGPTLLPSQPPSQGEKKEAEKKKTNPLLYPAQPSQPPRPSSKKPVIALAAPAAAAAAAPAPAAAAAPAAALEPMERTANMIERSREHVLDAEMELDLEKISPLFMEFLKRQDQTESKNPYRLEKEIYTSINRRSFYRFVEETYMSYQIPYVPKGPIDEKACEAIEASKREGMVQAFSYQRFISEYLRQASPYRGLLVYHGLGSGKTCSAIAAAEALYGSTNKKIIIMTPFSLRPNFISEITFCGFKHFNVNNHWVKQPIATEYESAPVYYYARDIMSLPEKYLNEVLRRPEEDRRVLWIPDFDKPSNYYDDIQISAQERNDIRQQIMVAIENRITFISYNGIQASTLKEYACKVDENGKRFFDDAVIVIDEVHNLIRLMQGNIEPYIRARAGRKRSVDPEPIVPGRWNPTLCDRLTNYKRAYLFYRLLTDARNSKIIGLSGTPIINFPEELAILSNVLAGYTECVEFSVDTKEEDDLEEIKNICEAEERVDLVRYETADQKTHFLVSTFQEGYIRADTEEDEKGESYVGVQYTDDETGQETIRDVYVRLKEAITESGFTITNESFVSYPRLPVDEETFRREFINPEDLSIKNRLVLQKRISGLISYYAASNEAFMPRVTKDELVRCEISDYALGHYARERGREIAQDANKKKEPGDIFSAVELFAKMKNPSSYRFRSRALCNFVFPEPIPRPFPGTQIDELAAEDEVIGEAQLQEIIEQASAEPAEDLDALRAIEEEESQALLPEEEEEQAEQAEQAEEKEAKQSGGAGEGDDQPSAPAPAAAPSAKAPASAALRARLAALRAAKEEAEKASASSSTAPSGLLPSSSAASSLLPSSAAPSGLLPSSSAAPSLLPSSLAVPSLLPSASAAPSLLPSSSAASSLLPSTSVAPSGLLPSASASAVAPSEKKTGVRMLRPKRVVEAPSLLPSSATPSLLPSASAAPAGLLPSASVAPSGLLPSASAAPAAPSLLPSAPAPPSEKKTGIRMPRPKRVVELPAPPVQEEKVEEEVASAPAPRRLVPYKELIQQTMSELNKKRDLFLKLDAVNPEGQLRMYSTKLHQLLLNLEKSPGSNLVYSQFKTVEGLGVLGVALKANGYSEIVIQGSDADPSFSPETVASFQKGPASGEKRFILFTGEGSKERRALILNLFNGMIEKLPPKIQKVMVDGKFTEQKNIRGAICWVIGITGAGAEGISLKCCRSVHIMESYWNNVRLDQVKGRAIRICSHTDLPYAERTVDIYTYCTVFSEEQKKTKLDVNIKTVDNNETSDERVLNVSLKKDKINQGLLQVMKEAAVDCGLNSADLKDVQCLQIDGPANQYLFDPNLEMDKRITGIQFKKLLEAQKLGMASSVRASSSSSSVATPSEAVQEAVSKAMGKAPPSASSAKTKVPTMNVQLIKYDGRTYFIIPYPFNTTRFKIYDSSDPNLRKQLGEAEKDPITDRISQVSLYPSP